MAEEEWRDVVGYEGKYQVSNRGNVKSGFQRGLERKAHKILKPLQTTNGYFRVCLINQQRTYYLIHRLVAHAFLENPENKPQVNHKDGNKHNNDVKNLEWATCSENVSHSTKILGHHQGCSNPKSKFSPQIVEEIKQLKAKGISNIVIANKYGVNRSTIERLSNGKTYNHRPNLESA